MSIKALLFLLGLLVIDHAVAETFAPYYAQINDEDGACTSGAILDARHVLTRRTTNCQWDNLTSLTVDVGFPAAGDTSNPNGLIVLNISPYSGSKFSVEHWREEPETGMIIMRLSENIPFNNNTQPAALPTINQQHEIGSSIHTLGEGDMIYDYVDWEVEVVDRQNCRGSKPPNASVSYLCSAKTRLGGTAVGSPYVLWNSLRCGSETRRVFILVGLKIIQFLEDSDDRADMKKGLSGIHKVANSLNWIYNEIPALRSNPWSQCIASPHPTASTVNDNVEIEPETPY